LAWVVVIACGSWGAHRLPDLAVGAAGGVAGSPSDRANAQLRRDFGDVFADPVILAVSAPALGIDVDPLRSWTLDAAASLRSLGEVSAVKGYWDTHDPRLRGGDGHVTLLRVTFVDGSKAGEQRAVVAVRQALAPLRAALLRLDPRATVALTGGAAAEFDVNALSAAGGDSAEKHALPLTLLILLFAFGTLIAAGLPFLLGLATTTTSLGAACVLAAFVPVSNLLGNVVTMVGLAIGIDYSLLMVTHYRENAAAGGATAATVALTVAHAGKTIAWSGLTVMIGFLGLLFSPILETRCAGIGGALVVCISVLGAVTLLPAILVLLGPSLERWSVIPQRLRLGSTGALWRRLGQTILRHRLTTLFASAGVALAFAAPVLQGRYGVNDERWFLPPGVESRAGADLIAGLGTPDATRVIHVLIATTDGSAILASDHRQALQDYATRLRRDPRVAALASPLDAFETAAAGAGRVSRDGRSAFFDVVPTTALAAPEVAGLARDLRGVAPTGALAVQVGGDPASAADYRDYTVRSLPKILGFVIGGTLLLLYRAFRSYLLPIKAVLTNLLAVAAGNGAIVAVFEWGWFSGLFGLERPFAVIPFEIPLMVFCLSFGLSMDYELFLLFRIRDEYRAGGDNEAAVVDGLVAVAPVVTGAGLIMAAVFGAFIGARLPALKMMGVGLCVAVLIDVALIRTFAVPAAMALAGRWNWVPGERGGNSAGRASR
jgi:RND superfamily putative drug exporter